MLNVLMVLSKIFIHFFTFIQLNKMIPYFLELFRVFEKVFIKKRVMDKVKVVNINFNMLSNFSNDALNAN